MSIALSEFWTRLVRIGITDSEGCRTLATAYQQAHEGTPPSGAKSLAKFLVQESHLSKFQARSLLSENPDRMRVGDWLLINEQGAAPFSHWLHVRHAVDGREGMLLQATPEALAGGRDLWLDAHQSIHGSNLQEFQCEVEPTLTLVFSPLPRGRSLQDWVQKQAVWPKAKAVEIGVALAEALQGMHARPLIHGGCRLDRVWMGKDGSVTLLRDPSGPPMNPWESEPTAWLETIDSPASYAAPEFIDQTRPCDVATDIYSLGCLLFRLVTGRPAVVSTSIPEAVNQHASEIPAEINEALQQREAGDPLFRVLAYAMSKNPEARFASADQLAAALNAIRPLITSEDVSPQAAEATSPPKESTAPPKEPAAPPKIITGTEETQATSKTQRLGKSNSEKSSSSKSSSDKSRSGKSQRDEKRQRSDKSTAAASTRPVAKSEKRAKHKTESSKPRQKSDARSADAVKQKDSAKKAIDKRADKPSPTKASTTSTATESNVGAETNFPPDSADQDNRLTGVVRESVASSPLSVSPASVPPIDAGPPVEAGPSSPPEPPPSDVSVSPPIVDAGDKAEVMFSVNSEPNNESTKSDQEPPKRETAPPRRRRKKKDRKAPIILGGLCVAVLILLVGLVVPKSDDVAETPRRRPPVPANIPPVTNQPSEDSTAPVEEGAAGYQLVSDPSLLYVPPFDADSEPPSLELLPPGPAVIVTWNVDAVLRGEHGPDLVESLSPDLDRLMQSVASMAKIPLEQMSRCTVALHPGSDGWPETSLSVELSEPQERDELIDLWEVGASRTSTGATIYAGDTADSMAFYLPESEDSTVSRFAVGTIKRISEVAEAEGGSIPLARSLQRLWDGASGEADVVALITPNFLFADGREMLRTTLPELFDPLKSVLIPDVAAMLMTVHTQSDHYYFETRLAPSGGTSEAALMRSLQSAVESWPQWAEDFIVTSVPDASWRLLATRLPGMMSFVSDQFRYGIVDSVIIANAYLPVEAVPQVSVAVAFAMNTTGQAVSTATVSSDPALTVDEMLNRKMTVSFDQESLEFALEAIVQAFREELPKGSTMPPARIIGSDLEAGGITQNQQVMNFSKNDIPLRAVLTDLVIGANPDKSSTGPKDPKQALIWVVHEDSSGKTEILITTRKAADGKYELPEEFQAS